MFRKIAYLISFVLVFVLAGNVAAVTYDWDGGGDTMLWNVPENWDPNGVPTSADTVQVYIPDANCVIDDSVAAECSDVYVGSGDGELCYLDMTGGTLELDGRIWLGNASDSNGVMTISGGVVNVGTTNQVNTGRMIIGGSGNGTLIMRGGELNVYDKTEVGRNAGDGTGTIYMEGGTINFNGNSADLEIAKYGNGAVYVTGGVINIQDYIKLGQESGSGSLYLYGGTVNASTLRSVEDCAGTGLIDIMGGTLTLEADSREVVNEFIDAGWLVAYDDFGVVNVEFDVDANQTVITATPLDAQLAQKPIPKDGAIDVARDVVPSWRPGIYADTHNVYFGTDADDVNEATVDDPRGVLVGQDLIDANYTPDNILDYGTTYYLRVDGVNDAEPNSPWKGDVWSFTVLNYPIVVEDFEDYTDFEPDTVWNTWSDGYGVPTNGSSAGYPDPDFIAGEHYLEDEIVHSGGWSMALFYNNNVGLSEVTRQLNANWNQQGVVTLTLFYHGVADNAPEQMFVVIDGVVVNNDDANAALVEEWTQWDIPLETLTSQGVNLSSVGSITLGFGNKANPVAGGEGHVFFDDIRLYLP